MNNVMRRAIALAPLVFALAAPAFAATPAPSSTPHKVVMPQIHFPTKHEHTEFLVEVNAKGQVVLVKSGKSCDNLTFNAQTYGNVLQMWIRHPDGTAEVGLYKVTYDYDPKTKSVHRGVSLVKAGGTWANQEGAANNMMDTVKKENAAALKIQESEQRKTNLPDLNTITGKPTPKPTPSTH